MTADHLDVAACDPDEFREEPHERIVGRPLDGRRGQRNPETVAVEAFETRAPSTGLDADPENRALLSGRDVWRRHDQVRRPGDGRASRPADNDSRSSSMAACVSSRRR